MAASCGNRDAVSVLLSLNADPEAKDKKGRIPGQSWLRQVSQRARADIGKYLKEAIERRNAVDDDASSCLSDSSSCTFYDEDVTPSGKAHPTFLKQESSSSVCSEAVPLARPSMANLLPSWGLGTSRKNLGAVSAGEASFGTDGVSTRV